MAQEMNATELDFLLRFPTVPNVTTPVDFMSSNSWGGIKVFIVISFLAYKISECILFCLFL